MSLPDVIEPYRNQGKRYLENSQVGEVLFSGPTYQIEVKDKKKCSYVFVQVDKDDTIKDLFCSCEESSEKGACGHMAAAALYVHSKGKQPIHKLFYGSFWKTFFFSLFEIAKQQDARVEKEVLIASKTVLGKIIGFQELFEGKKKHETEENSIKFSSLSEEEIDNWKAGRPALPLQFELSSFSDIAKYFFFKWLENKDSVHVIFNSQKTIPTQVTISCEEKKCEFALSEELLLEIIPYLDTVSSSLTFSKGEDVLELAKFDEEEGTFTCTWKKRGVRKKEKSSSFGPYQFVPGVGFCLNHVGQERNVEVVPKASVDGFIDRYIDDLKKITRYSFSEYEKEISYSLSFSKGALSITPYLEEKGDISLYFGNWVFSKKTGFKHLQYPKFQKKEVIREKEISNFILMNREWLMQFEGFHVHLARVNQEISFSVENGSLIFHMQVKTKKRTSKDIEIGDFIFREDEGFFLKEAVELSKELPIEKPIAPFLISSFIRGHEELLETVPNFFLEKCPIAAVTLHIYLRKKGIISIEPLHTYVDTIDKETALFFDEYVYVPKKGFYRLGPDLYPAEYIREIEAASPEWNQFFLELLPKLKKSFQCDVDPKLEGAPELHLVAKKICKKGAHTFESELFLSSKEVSGKRTNLSSLLQAMKNKERFFPSEDGLVDLSEAKYHWLKKLLKKHRGVVFSLNTIDFFALNAFLGVSFDDSEEESLVKRLFDLKEPEEANITLLQASLRSYQRNGVEWLWFLYVNKLSGLLCDDMGVGKTHQAMGLMASVKATVPMQAHPLFLVVVPTSLIFHWEEKLKSFLPSLKIKVYTGAGRSLEDGQDWKYDLVLTSYGIFRSDHKKICANTYEVAIFDELQIAKNHVSQIYAALLATKAHMRLGMTGTPVENEVRELKALFDIVLPGYMLDSEDFREFFINPIEKQGDFERRALLGRFVKPFILRRRKQDVLQDLPEKTEEKYSIELSQDQKDLYREIANKEGRPLVRLLEDEETPVPYFHIFALLAALKQVCNHPASYYKDIENFEKYASGKWDGFVELLEEAFESGQKVVVFSQYLAMLDIMESYFNAKGIQFSQIRGKTIRRKEEVERFQNDPKCRVFLGSLQAAGLGIDLTAASVVIHYDRWWNAARENQATDRVHRIGQLRGVQVFKFVTRGTIEEKIDELIDRKKELVDHLITCDDHSAVKKLTRSELLSLVKDITEI